VVVPVTVLLLLCAAVGCRGDVWRATDDLPDDPALRDALLGLESEDVSIDGLDEVLREAAAFRAHPVDVNSAGPAELMRVPFLDPASAVRVVERRRALGPVESLRELVSRGCLSREVLGAVRPYLVARPPSPVEATLDLEAEPPAARASVPLTWELRLRATARERWESSWDERGLLSGAGTFARLRVSRADRLDVSIACEKDAGETNLADHLVGSIVWRDEDDSESGGIGRARDTDAPSDTRETDIVAGLGDFVASWGQGLLFAAGGFPSESGYPRRRDSVRRYDGAGEVAARRGAFVTVSRGRARVMAVLARTAQDAAVDETGHVTSIRTTGYHRTEGEKAGASSLEETLAGVRLSFDVPVGLEFSGSALRVAFSPGLAPGDPERERFALSGEELTAGGVDIRLGPRELAGGCDVRAGGEVVSVSSGGVAALAAARVRCGGSRLSAGGAYLSRDYWVPAGGGAPGFSGGSNGATGWLRAEYRSTADWKIWVGTRVTRRPWRSYHSELPDGAVTMTIGGEVRTMRGWRVAAESRTSSRRLSDGDPPLTAARAARRVRVSVRTGGSVPLDVSAWRVSSLCDGLEDGSLLAVALRIGGSLGSGTSYAAGLTSASLQGSAPSLVQYEPRLPGEFGLTSLNAAGTRWYIRVQTGLREGWGISARLSGGPSRGALQFGLGLDARG
jgi:hypothetical protein